MRIFLSLLIVGCGLSSLRADEFEVSSVIHPVVAKLPAPKMIEGFAEGQMAITTNSDAAALHFKHGLTMLNTAWDFEAYRHFCETVKLDPECLMGYWGISLCLASGQHEFFGQRKAAIERMLDLLESEKGEGVDRWNALETGFAQGAGYLLTNGRQAAARSFEALAKKFPANIQSRILTHFLERDGFDRFGKPRLGQRSAVEGLRELLKEHPENLSVMAFWVNLLAETPGEVAMMREEVLPVSKRLVERFPDYAPFRLMLTQMELRCGNAEAGIAVALKAKELYEAYLTEEKVTIYDCDGLVRSDLYLAGHYQLKGELDKALAVAKKLAGTKVVEERVFSKGAVMLMWEGRTLGARMMAEGTRKEDFLKGQEIMASLEDEDWYMDKSFAVYYRDCLAFYLGIRGALEEGKVDVAKRLFDQLLLRIQGMEKTRSVAMETGFYASWLRGMNTLGVFVPELRGLVAEQGEGATKEAAVTWFLSARDRQARPSSLLPPSIPYPMQWRLGNHELSLKKNEEAADWFEKGLALRPNHLELLKGLQGALVSLGKKEEAAAVAKQIEALK